MWPSSPSKLTQPRWGWPLAGAFPRVARGSQSWAGGHNPFGIGIVPFRLSWFSVRCSRPPVGIEPYPRRRQYDHYLADELRPNKTERRDAENAKKRRDKELSAALCESLRLCVKPSPPASGTATNVKHDLTEKRRAHHLSAALRESLRLCVESVLQLSGVRLVTGSDNRKPTDRK